MRVCVLRVFYFDIKICNTGICNNIIDICAHQSIVSFLLVMLCQFLYWSHFFINLLKINVDF